MTPSEFREDVWCPYNWNDLATVWWKNYDDMLSRFHTIPACHGRTDRRTDRITISISRVSSSMLTRDKNEWFQSVQTWEWPWDILQVVWFWVELKGQRSTLGLDLTAIRNGFELYECLLVIPIIKCDYDVRVYLNARLGEVKFECKWLSYEDVRVVTVSERVLKLLQLPRREVRSRPTSFLWRVVPVTTHDRLVCMYITRRIGFTNGMQSQRYYCHYCHGGD